MKIIEPSVGLVDPIDTAAVMKKLERCGRVSHKSEGNIKADSADAFVRNIIKLGHESVLEHVSVTFRIVCDRAIMAELTRHRLASFTVESTRYVAYDDSDKRLIINEPRIPAKKRYTWVCALEAACCAYQELLDADVKPEIARSVLPLCTATELYMTANLREWRHILRLRTSKAAHPQMRQIMNQVLATFKELLPVVVEDIKPCTSPTKTSTT